MAKVKQKENFWKTSKLFQKNKQNKLFKYVWHFP